MSADSASQQELAPVVPRAAVPRAQAVQRAERVPDGSVALPPADDLVQDDLLPDDSVRAGSASVLVSAPVALLAGDSAEPE